jgi:hypothetical protein
VRRAIPETHEIQGTVFSERILPESLLDLDLPGSDEVRALSKSEEPGFFLDVFLVWGKSTFSNCEARENLEISHVIYRNF